MQSSFDDVDFLNELHKWNSDETSEFYVRPEEFEIAHVPGFKYPLKKANNVLIGNSIINVSNLKSLNFKSDDVLLAGFPKSGTFRKIIKSENLTFNYKPDK